MVTFPQIDPIIFELGPLAIRWYGLAYVAAFLLGLAYFKHLVKQWPANGLTAQKADDLLGWLVIGVIVGGRLGYCLFYNAPFYLNNPIEMLKIWHGGMSFHGGFIGVLAASYLFAKRHNIAWVDIGDRLAPTACIGLFFGRLANFINAELYGRITDVPWAMVFPTGGELPRHPSQLYEAGLEGLLLFLILHFYTKTKPAKYMISGVFFIGYGTFRSAVELVREPDGFTHLQGGIFEWLTMGQTLSLPMILIGLGLIWLARTNGRA